MAVKKSRSILKEWSGFFPSHRVRGPQAANKIKSIFRGGVYVAKYSLRGAERSETPSSKKSTALF